MHITEKSTQNDCVFLKQLFIIELLFLQPINMMRRSRREREKKITTAHLRISVGKATQDNYSINL